MKKRSFPLCLLLALFLLLSGCSQISKTRNVISIDLTNKPDKAVKAFVNGKLVTFHYDTQQFYVMDPETGAETEMCGPGNWGIVPPSFVYADGKYYTYITNRDEETILYEFDVEKPSVTPVPGSNCRDVSPMLYINRTPNGILQLKAPRVESGRTTYFDLLHLDTGETELVLQAPGDGFFEHASVYGDTLYVLAGRNGSSNDVLQLYDLEDYHLIKEISLDPDVSSYINQTRIYVMEVLGDYVYFENGSFQGMIGKISDDAVTKVLERDGLIAAVCYDRSEQTKERLFYIKDEDGNSTECIMLQLDTGELHSFNVKMKDKHYISYIVVDGDRLLLSEGKVSQNKLINDTYIVHIYNYHDFVNQSEA